MGCKFCVLTNVTTLDGYTGNGSTLDGTKEHLIDIGDGIELTIEGTAILESSVADGSVIYIAEIDGSDQTCIQVVVATVYLIGKPLERACSCDFIITIY